MHTSYDTAQQCAIYSRMCHEVHGGLPLALTTVAQSLHSTSAPAIVGSSMSVPHCVQKTQRAAAMKLDAVGGSPSGHVARLMIWRCVSGE